MKGILALSVSTFLLDKFENHLFKPITYPLELRMKVCNTPVIQHLRKDLYLYKEGSFIWCMFGRHIAVLKTCTDKHFEKITLPI